MAEMTIHLRRDPATGKKDIIVTLRSDEDALPHEHEQQHKALVDKLINGGLLQATEAGKIVVEREQAASEPTVPAGKEPQAERRAQGQGR